MEALVHHTGAESLLNIYSIIKMNPHKVDSLEMIDKWGDLVPLAGVYKAFIRNFQGMYSICEKQIDWSNGMILGLGYHDY
jgi:ABC-type tungstate transport system permease subunit